MSGWRGAALEGRIQRRGRGLGQIPGCTVLRPPLRTRGVGEKAKAAANGAGVLLHLKDERAPDPSLGSAPIGEPMIRAGLYRFTLPSTRPPAMRPCGMPSVVCFPTRDGESARLPPPRHQPAACPSRGWSSPA